MDHAVSDTPLSLHIGDLDGDARLHAVVALGAGPGPRIADLGGTSVGGFGTPTFVDTGAPVVGVELADVDRDGRLGLAAAQAPSRTVSILLGLDNSSWSATAHYTVNARLLDFEQADLGADGWLDLATADGAIGTISSLLAQLGDAKVG